MPFQSLTPEQRAERAAKKAEAAAAPKNKPGRKCIGDAPIKPYRAPSVGALLAGNGNVRDKMISKELQAPARINSAEFLHLVEERLWFALQAMGSDFIALASARDLTSMVSMLIEKRNLLKGEPTAIVRNETRQSLDKVAGLLLVEAKRRGIALPGEFINITPTTADEQRNPS